MQAARLIEEEVRYLKNAMGHEDASEEDYAEARDGCVDDLVYFPSRESFGLVSVASTNDRLAALQHEFEVVKKHMEAETRKAVRMEHKVKVLTHGYQVQIHLLFYISNAFEPKIVSLADVTIHAKFLRVASKFCFVLSLPGSGRGVVEAN